MTKAGAAEKAREARLRLWEGQEEGKDAGSTSDNDLLTHIYPFNTNSTRSLDYLTAYMDSPLSLLSPFIFQITRELCNRGKS